MAVVLKVSGALFFAQVRTRTTSEHGAAPPQQVERGRNRGAGRNAGHIGNGVAGISPCGCWGEG